MKQSVKVDIGKHEIGANSPIQIQSMIVSDALDTEKAVEEIIELFKSGCPLVRLSIPSQKEAENLKVIKEKLDLKGFDIPLVADIHFTPKAAEIAAKYVEKIRINPGNFADKKRFESKEYTSEEYQMELDRISKVIQPFIEVCKSKNRTIRIGVNHGSLSDRITSYYGDTVEGMVASAFEYLQLCVEANFNNVVVSLKSSNPKIMIDANRLFQKEQHKKGWNFPIHLGVTEAGFGEDGRIKSALGIGTLLREGIGDTIRVSLTEDPRNEIPVAKFIAKFIGRQNSTLKDIVFNNGKFQDPKVAIDLRHQEKLGDLNWDQLGYFKKDNQWVKQVKSVDYLILDQLVNFEFPYGIKILVPSSNCLELSTKQITRELNLDQNKVILLSTSETDPLGAFRKAFATLSELNIQNEVILLSNSSADLDESRILETIDLGGIFLEGYAEGICIKNRQLSLKENIDLCFGILQATGRRITKTEFISCPSCGRTQFDLQETTSKIKENTQHLVGLKIGIMGCIVNGPGEMADADYGYVGSGKGLISLYRKQKVVKRNIPSEVAVDALIKLIKENGDWVEP